jgi:hypothetical protein
VKTAGALLLFLNLAFIMSILWKLARLVHWQQLWRHASKLTARCCSRSNNGVVSAWLTSLQVALDQQHASRRAVELRSKDSQCHAVGSGTAAVGGSSSDVQERGPASYGIGWGRQVLAARERVGGVGP